MNYKSSSVDVVKSNAGVMGKLLAVDIVQYFICNPPPSCHYAKMLRRIADNISEKHSILLTSIIKKLALVEGGINAANIVSVTIQMSL